MKFIPVTLAVLNDDRSREVRPWHSLNMKLILVTSAVLNSVTSREVRP